MHGAVSSKLTDVGRGGGEWGVTVNPLMHVSLRGVPYSVHKMESNSVSTSICNPHKKGSTNTI
jgi:hypothetical protein